MQLCKLGEDYFIRTQFQVAWFSLDQIFIDLLHYGSMHFKVLY